MSHQEIEKNSIKRPNDTSPVKTKRIKLASNKEPVLEPAFSGDEIITAVQRSTEEELIGDFSWPYTLPITKGRHQDLKSITASTVADLITGRIINVEFKIIDCRYPYQFNGGHISGAVNLYKKNGTAYPALDYPELYLLDGGYNKFFRE
ncbi:M-phase inducer phosphatase 1-like [Coccinella septempunctata]|uniref:M-phase inducer phosphatase 1-like n=1 Tax=Coccinella septempunctata TaxID=41139 RepID=UPI001D06C0A3|nr:M-phase inducer phosphatase 1-like [Coccinella septempunctata]